MTPIHKIKEQHSIYWWPSSSYCSLQNKHRNKHLKIHIIQTGQRQNSWLFISMTEEPNLRLPRKNPHHYSKRVAWVVDPDGGANLNGLWDWVGMAPRMGPESIHATFPLGRPVSRKAGKKILMAIRAGVELGASGFQFQSSDHIGHATSSI